MLLFSSGERVFQDVECHGSLLVADDEWRADADGAFSAAEHHEAALEGEGLNAIAQGGGGLARGFILDQFNGDHETAPAHIANHGVRLLPGVEALEHFCADTRGVGDAFALKHIDGGEG